MAALPYMPLFVADYLADTAHLTAVQHGAYLLLIMNYWQRGGPLPNDDVKLARIARMSKRDWTHNKDEILEFFHVQDNLLYHNRIADELARVEAKSLKCKDAAQASVQRRFGKRSASVEPTDTQAHTVSEPKGSSSAGVVLEERKRAVGSCLRKAFPPPNRVSDEQWSAFQQQRKKKLNSRSYTLLTNKLTKLEAAGHDPGELIDLAIERGWETVFEPKEFGQPVNGKQYVSASGYVYRGSLEQIQREATRRNDRDMIWQIELDRKAQMRIAANG